MRMVFVFVVLLLAGCSKRAETPPAMVGAPGPVAPAAPPASAPVAASPTPVGAAPVDGTAPAEGSSVGAVAVGAVPVGAMTDPGACVNLEVLEDKIGDGLLSPAEETCLRARLEVASGDAERYHLVHLLTLDLDASGRGAEALALRRAHMPRVDCGKVEGRLKEVCGVFKAVAK